MVHTIQVGDGGDRHQSDGRGNGVEWIGQD